MIYYSETYPAEYVTVMIGESPISFPGIPVGAAIIQVELETKPLQASEWNWNPNSLILTLTDPTIVSAVGMLFSVLYKIYKTS